MDITVANDFISPLALVGALCVGYIVKNLVPSEEANRFIPLIAALTGFVICAAEALGTGAFSAETVVTGLVSGLASTGLYEAFKNLIGGGSDGR